MNTKTLACMLPLWLFGCKDGAEGSSAGTDTGTETATTAGTTAGDPTGVPTTTAPGGTTSGTGSGTASGTTSDSSGSSSGDPTGDPTSDPTTATETTTATSSETGMDCEADVASDDFERLNLGNDWTIVFPPAPNDQVRIVDSSDLGMGPGPQGFALVNWTKQAFTADQFCEATLPTDATPGWIYMVYVRWRAGDLARYGFAYNGDMGQDTFGDWIFKYDGVPSDQTRIIASAAAKETPQPGDTIRVEIVGYTLRGYLNGTLVLEGTDNAPDKIADGVPGLAARWADGNQSTDINVKIWESWSGGGLCENDSSLKDPTAQINHPGAGEARKVNVDIPFIGIANDPQEGVLTGESMVWTSDLEGQFGTGTDFNAPLTVLGKHTITLTVTDIDGNKGITSITQNIIP